LRQVTLLSAPLLPSAALIDAFKQFAGHNPSIRRVQFNKVANIDKEAEDTTRYSGLRKILGALSGLVHLVLVSDSTSVVIRALLYALEGEDGSEAGVLLPNLENIVIAKWTEEADISALAQFCSKRRDVAKLCEMNTDRGQVIGNGGRNAITVSIRDCEPKVKAMFRQSDQAFLAATNATNVATSS
jgi:hypothetical protein